MAEAIYLAELSWTLSFFGISHEQSCSAAWLGPQQLHDTSSMPAGVPSGWMQKMSGAFDFF